MYITWKDTFRIMLAMFDFNPENLALQLQVSPSTVTRIISGETGKPRLDADDIYTRLFAPGKTEITGSESWLLSLLKDTIVRLGFFDVMADVWDAEGKAGKEDYKHFVMTLLNRTRQNTPKNKPHPESEALPLGTYATKQGVSSDNKTYAEAGQSRAQPGKRYAIEKQSFYDDIDMDDYDRNSPSDIMRLHRDMKANLTRPLRLVEKKKR